MLKAVLQNGTVFADRYEILRCISAGGMGTIYEVMHRETRRRRALKVMLPTILKDADLRRRFALEAQITADVDSEHVVETFDAGIDAATGSPFLVMELLRGEDLGTRLERLGSLPPREVVGLLHQAATALDKTHAAGIVHRDLKPENLFVSVRDGKSLRLKVLDFGIAKVFRETATGRVTRSMGTPLYMSPEQGEGDPRIGPPADLYALGHIAFTLLVGEAYWTKESRQVDHAVALLARILRDRDEPATARARALGVTLPDAFDAWFDRATARAPTDRYPSAIGQVAALAKVFDMVDATIGPVPGTVPDVTTSDRAAGDSSDAASGEPGGGTPQPFVRRRAERVASGARAKLELAEATTMTGGAQPAEPASELLRASPRLGSTDGGRSRPTWAVAVAVVLAGVAVALVLARPGGGGAAVPAADSNAVSPASAGPPSTPASGPSSAELPPASASVSHGPAAASSPRSVAPRPSGKWLPRTSSSAKSDPSSAAASANAPASAAPEAWRTR